MSTKYIASNWRLPNKAGVDSYLNDNYGLIFSGTSEYINCGGQSLFNGLTAFSVSCWIKTDGTQQDYAAIFSYQSSTTQYVKLAFYPSEKDRIRVVVRPGSSNPVYVKSSAGSIVDGEWAHIVAVGDANNLSNLNVYINGVLDNDVTQGNITTLAQSSDIHIGTDAGNPSAREFEGDISEVAVFDYALTSTQISTLYGSSSLGAGNPMALKPAPVAFYPLGDNSSGNPLTQPNEAVEDASVFEFDGGSYIDCGIPSFLNSTSVFSSSLWFNTNDVGTQTTLWAVGSSASQLWAVSKFEDDLIIYGGTSTKYYRKNNLFSINTWYNLIVVYDGSQSNADRFKVYLNGVLLTGATINGTIETITPTFTTNFNIGRIGYAAASYFNGEISNVVFWNSDQSLEISNIYNSGVPATSYTNTPTAWYKLDQSANWDVSGSGYWQIPDAVSAYPQSFDFDGTNYIETSEINLGLENTISFWAKSDGTNFNGMVWGGILQSNYYTVFLTSTNNVFYRVGGGANTFNDADIIAALGSGEWFHCALVRSNGGADVACYINGDLKQTITGIVGSSNNTIVQNIGARSIADFKINGELSNIAIWNSDQTTEISNIYNSGVPATSYTNTPSAWYKLDNTATFSTNWSIPDASGNGNDGTSSGMTEQNLVNNNVSALNGESSGMTSANLVLTDLTRNLPYDSYSFNFDSTSDDHINCGNPSALNITGSITLSCWVKSSNTGANYKLLVKDDGTSRSFQINTNSSSSGPYALFWLGGSNMRSVNAGGQSIVDGNWHNLVCVFKSGDYVRMYIDGIQVGNTSVTETTLDSSTADFIISTNGYGGTVGVDGNVSNVSVFNEALTSTEVMKLYSNGMPQDLSSFTPAPVAWWTLGSNSFFNGSNFICKDLIGSNDGTSVNAGVDALQGNTPRSEANGTGTNMDIPTNLEGQTKYSSNNSWSINMSESARVADTP